MAEKRKYPKSFYDDGLGEILEWIDEEVLVHSDRTKLSEDGDKGSKKNRKNKAKLYGDNELLDEKIKAPKRVKINLDETEPGAENIDKDVKDKTRRLINQLVAEKMPKFASEFEKLYSTYQRTSINTSIFNNIESAIINPHALTKRKLVAELMLLISYLNFKISHDIGAYLVHRLIHKFELYYKTSNDDSDKKLDNIVLCIINLYSIGLISANVIFELTKRICSCDFNPKSVELLLLIIKNVGIQLRKDNPQLMRQLIVMAKEKSSSLKSRSDLGNRVTFMMDALCAVKDNHVSKLKNYGCDIDKDTIETTLKGLIQKTTLPENLSDASYEEIVRSSNWYLLETRLDEADSDSNKKKAVESKSSISEKDIKICKALGLNKPAERTILSALLRAADFTEASNLIIGFGLNHCSDAMLVCLQVAIHEKKYNPFHFNLINSLCKFNRKYKMATKFAIQDKIRILSQMASQRVKIFKNLTLELIKSDAIPITVLKAIEWADLSAGTKEYLVHLFEYISEMPEEDKRKIMVKVEKKSSFAGAMRTFINCFLKDCRLFS